MRCRVIERVRWFVFIGSDFWDPHWGVTVGWGPRSTAAFGESKWRNIWRISVRLPVAVSRRR